MADSTGSGSVLREIPSGCVSLASAGSHARALISIRQTYRQSIDEHLKESLIGEYPATTTTECERVGSGGQSVAGKNNTLKRKRIESAALFGNGARAIEPAGPTVHHEANKLFFKAGSGGRTPGHDRGYEPGRFGDCHRFVKRKAARARKGRGLCGDLQHLAGWDCEGSCKRSCNQENDRQADLPECS